MQTIIIFLLTICAVTTSYVALDERKMNKQYEISMRNMESQLETYKQLANSSSTTNKRVIIAYLFKIKELQDDYNELTFIRNVCDKVTKFHSYNPKVMEQCRIVYRGLRLKPFPYQHGRLL